MKIAVSSKQKAIFRTKFFVFFVCLPLTAYCLLSCSIPNLEKSECTQSRDAVKRFYSFHFGNDMRPTPENLRTREQFLTSELIKILLGSTETAKDYFTATDDYPKAFRVGECKAESVDKTSFQVVLLWRDDNRSEQKEVTVDAVNTGGKWLINAVSAGRP